MTELNELNDNGTCPLLNYSNKKKLSSVLDDFNFVQVCACSRQKSEFLSPHQVPIWTGFTVQRKLKKLKNILYKNYKIRF
jgi:hypothetical protein